MNRRIMISGGLMMLIVSLVFLSLNCGSDDNETPETCTTDATHCTGTVIQTCVDGAWVDGTDCAAYDKVCQLDEDTGLADCVESELTCTTDATQCNGTIVQTCQEGAWVDGTDCATDDKVCEVDVDTEAAMCIDTEDECEADAYRCNDTIIEKCLEGIWEEEEDCADADKICEEAPDASGAECVEDDAT